MTQYCLKLSELSTFFETTKKPVTWYDFLLRMNTHHIYDTPTGMFEVYL